MTDFSQRMAALRQRFVHQAGAEAAEIESGAAAQTWSAVRDLSHRVAGRAGMFGFPEITDLARALEEAVEGRASVTELENLASDLVRRLRSLAG